MRPNQDKQYRPLGHFFVCFATLLPSLQVNTRKPTNFYHFHGVCDTILIMKTESYNKAIDNIYNIVGQSVIRHIPTLDYIMGFDKMSSTDKIWYEAYKKYGNRNHTWQDFRDMFYDDIENMEKTVAHWKTWDEINNLLKQQNKQITEIRRLLQKYNVQSIDENDAEKYEQYKKDYPDLMQAYQQYLVTTNEATPNYSTFNPEIAKLEKEFESKSKTISSDDKKAKIDLIVEYLKKMDEYINLKNGDFVVGERIETYRKIILKNPEILKTIQNFDNLSVAEKINLARMILDESSKIHGTPKGRVVHDDAPDGPHVLRGNQGGGYDRYGERFLLKGDNFPGTWNFLKILAHEDAHRIDYYNAEYGMIGSQLMKFVTDNYLSNACIDEKLYRKWATEQSSYYLDTTIATALATALKYDTTHQNA